MGQLLGADLLEGEQLRSACLPQSLTQVTHLDGGPLPESDQLLLHLVVRRCLLEEPGGRGKTRVELRISEPKVELGKLRGLCAQTKDGDVAQGVAHDVLAFKAFYGCTEQLQRIEQLGLFGDDDLADREVLLSSLVAQVLEDMGLSAAEVGRHEHAARLLVAGDASAKILQPLAEDAQHILGRTAERAHGVTVGDARAQRLDGAPSGDLCIHLVPPDAVEILTMGA